MTSRTASSCLKLAKCLDGRESRDKLYAKLTEMLTKLDVVKESANLFIQVVGVDKRIVVKQDESSGSRVTSSILPEDEIFGRVEDRNKIVDLLKGVEEPESSNRNIPIITIISDGGVGKTTLAQFVYNDKEVKEHFDLRIWVCVSNDFNKFRLTEEMLESITEQMLESTSEKHEVLKNFDTLARRLETMIKSRRFLLVLDDVWYDGDLKRFENEHRWTDLFSSLKAGARGSKILVTTRDRNVAEMFGWMYKYDLKQLDDHHCWRLLTSCAFGNRNLGNQSELEAIGMEIVERLNGLPLAAKVVGGLLKDRTDAEEWRTILKELKQGNILAYRLGYEYLPEQLKPCFAYCSIFPKDWKFEPEKLVLLWIAQGYIQAPYKHDRPKLMIDIGMDYFNELLSRSLFEKVERDSSVCYVIHDLIHDLAQFVAKDECFRIDDGKESILKDTIRHLGIVVLSDDKLVDFQLRLKKISNLKKLRTLIFFGGWHTKLGGLTIGMLKEARSLRVLDFGNLGFKKFFGVLDRLLHLRYLNLGNNSYILPKSWCGHYHLQVLGARSSLQFSKSLIRLIKFGKLTYFDTQELVFQVDKKRGDKIGVVKDIVISKQNLCIENLENFSRKEEASKADLGSQQYMRGLELKWGWRQNINGHNAGEEIGVAEALKPHPNLKKLTISKFVGIRSPSWLETKWLINIQSIHLTFCKNLEALPPLGHLPLLKKLQIRRMDAIKQVGSEFYGCNENESEGVRVGFPSLEVLRFSEMPEWLEWSGVEFPVFPRLRELDMDLCPKLVSLPVGALMSSLESLCISDVSDALLSRYLQGLTLLSRLSIKYCEKMTSLAGLGALPSLKTLVVEKCPGVKSLPEEGLPASIEYLVLSECEKLTSLGGLGTLASLKRLTIMNCSGVKSLSEEGLPASIEFLQLRGCEELTSLEGLGALTSLKHLEVCNCPKVKSLREEGLPASIEHLKLQRCEELTSLGVLGALTSLKHLEVLECPGVKSLPAEGLPTSIEHLALWGCEELTSLRGLGAITSLKHLELCNCPKVKLLREEGLPASIERLELQSCEELTSLGGLGALTSLKHLEVRACRGVKSLPEEGLPTSLEHLVLWGCEKLMSLGGLGALTSLRHLEVNYCRKVKSLPEEGLSASIVYLRLWECNRALKQQIRRKKGPEWDKIAHITHTKFTLMD